MEKLKSMEAAKPTEIFGTTDKKATAGNTNDGFANLAARLGFMTPGTVPPGQSNLLSEGHYQFNLVTRNRIQLEAAYRGSWIVGRVIDTKAKDMTRAGIEITTNEKPEKVDDLQAVIKRLQIWRSTRLNVQWGNLYGGCLAIMQIKGQDVSSPLDPETIQRGQFKGLAVYDRWQVWPVLDDLITEGPEIGLPKFYDIILGGDGTAPQKDVNQNNGRVRVHHSRCLRNAGIELPMWQAITESLWGESVLERMWDRLISFDDASLATGNLIHRAQLRTVGVESLREILAMGGEAEENLVKMFEYMRMFQNNEGVTLLDKNDVFASTAYSFAGLADVIIQHGQQVSGAAEIPLVALFGQSPAGLSATGESDMRMYYDTINAKQEAELRPFFEVLLKVMWRSEVGDEPPSDLAFTFVPLWQMSATDKATVAKTTTDTIIAAHQEGGITTAGMMKELKQSSTETGLFTHITDDDIEEAENVEPPMPGEPGDPNAVPAPGDKPGPAEVLQKPEEALKKAAAGDSAWQRIKRWLIADTKPAIVEVKITKDHTPTPTKVSDAQVIAAWVKANC